MKKQTVKRVGSSTAKTAPVKKTARKVASAASSRSTKDILVAGMQALGNVHGEAVARQSRVFESLLGIHANRQDQSTRDSGAAPNPLIDPLKAALDPFGFRKFEDVFDQRVARALQHLELPTSVAFAELRTEVERLRERVALLEAQGRKR